MPCQYSQLPFFGQIVFVRYAVWREGRTGATSGVSNRENELRRGRHNNRRGFEKMKTYFGHGLKNSHKIYKHYIFTCILLICQHYKLSGRTRKYEKWTSCRAISGRAMLSAYRCGLSMGTVPTTKTTVDCGPKSPVPTPDESLNYYDWLLLHGIAIYFT